MSHDSDETADRPATINEQIDNIQKDLTSLHMRHSQLQERFERLLSIYQQEIGSKAVTELRGLNMSAAGGIAKEIRNLY